MRTRLRFEILSQPDNTTCGPTCLQSIYAFWGDKIGLRRVVEEVPTLASGGTLAVHMANHALARGYLATLYTYNLQVFDPTWFKDGEPIAGMEDKLLAQARHKSDARLQSATEGYVTFLRRGGRLRYRELTTGLIRRYLNKKAPMMAGLSATYLYGCARETGIDPEFDDVRGEPSGHFVVLCGYDKEEREVLVADPLHSNPTERHLYEVPINRVIGAIFLGIVTYDANLLVIEPNPHARGA